MTFMGDLVLINSDCSFFENETSGAREKQTGGGGCGGGGVGDVGIKSERDTWGSWLFSKA